jgi:hypothetical protein
MPYFSVQMIQLSLLAGLGLLQLLGEPLVGVLEGVLGVVVDDGTVGGLDTGVDLRRNISNARRNRKMSTYRSPHHPCFLEVTLDVVCMVEPSFDI